VNGRTVCAFAFSRSLPESFWAKKWRAGTANASFTQTKKLISECNNRGFFTIGIFHWGAELMPKPKDYQKKLARLVVDGGADLVLGHHPHILQSVEIYKGKMIAYSIGNSLFGTLTTGRIQEGIAVRIIFSQKNPKLVTYDLVPLNVNNSQIKFIPRPLLKGEDDALAKHMPSDRRCREVASKRLWRCNL
jgi:poly-gamma-glutamate synthesis protein (capsule biosynthesis protein)